MKPPITVKAREQIAFLDVKDKLRLAQTVVMQIG
jgi:hypothetical protein